MVDIKSGEQGEVTMFIFRCHKGDKLVICTGRKIRLGRCREGVVPRGSVGSKGGGGQITFAAKHVVKKNRT